MLMFGAGLAVLALLLWSAGAFGRARVATIKALLAWVAALAGLSLAGLLLLTGRGGAALSGAVLLGPLIWQNWRRREAAAPRPKPTRSATRMTRAEALDVLGLSDPVTDEEVRVAWRNLMRAAHPDGGGTDWLAAKVNEAKEVLLKG